MIQAALWIRVSTLDQDPSTQESALRRFAGDRGYQVVEVFRGHVSAWKGKHHPELARVVAAAATGAFEVLVVEAYDRLTREGPAALLANVKALEALGCEVVSIREHAGIEAARTAGVGIDEVLLAMFGMAGGSESSANSSRMKRVIAERKAAGKPWGRPKGSKDLRPRRKAGYYIREARKRGEIV